MTCMQFSVQQIILQRSAMHWYGIICPYVMPFFQLTYDHVPFSYTGLTDIRYLDGKPVQCSLHSCHIFPSVSVHTYDMLPFPSNILRCNKRTGSAILLLAFSSSLCKCKSVVWLVRTVFCAVHILMHSLQTVYVCICLQALYLYFPNNAGRYVSLLYKMNHFSLSSTS